MRGGVRKTKQDVVATRREPDGAWGAAPRGVAGLVCGAARDREAARAGTG